MRQFYQVLPSENDPEREGVAWALDIDDPLYHPREAVAASVVHVFELRDILYSDFLMTDAGWNLFSPAFREVLDAHAVEEDGLRWCQVTVKREEEHREYHTYYFDAVPDVLNQDDTIFAGDFVVRPSFRAAEAESARVITVDEAGGIGRMYVTQHVVSTAMNAKITGVMFGKVRTK
ncbi:hypothetical protein KKF84_13295 [Myxococcota bacterium]|nr:hypothetical protein [Myxococcota bacterium]MBU1536294.1 hypothetical protein [Myxococcota bacterium]